MATVDPKKALIEKLKPPQGWTATEATKFRTNYKIKTGKSFTGKPLYFPFSGFAGEFNGTTFKDTAGINKRFDEISGRNPLFQKTIDASLAPAKMQSTTKPPSQKRRKIGFQPCVLFVRDNASVGHFEQFTKDGNISHLVKVINKATRHAYKNGYKVSGVDTSVYDAAGNFLKGLLNSINAKRVRVYEEINREEDVVLQYFKGARPAHLGVPSTKYVHVNGEYARLVAINSARKTSARNAIVDSHMVVQRYKLWKQWQEFAKGAEKRYSNALKAFQAIEYLENDTDEESNLVNLPIAQVTSQTANQAVQKAAQVAKKAVLDACKAHYVKIVADWESKFMAMPNSAAVKAVDPSAFQSDLNQVNCSTTNQNFLQQEWNDADKSIKDAQTRIAQDKLAIENANAITQAQLKADAAKKRKAAVKKKKEAVEAAKKAKEDAKKAKEDAEKAKEDALLEKFRVLEKKLEEKKKKEEEEAAETNALIKEAGTMIIEVLSLTEKSDIAKEDGTDRRNQLKWFEKQASETRLTTINHIQGLDIEEDAGARLISPSLVVFDTFYLEDPRRQMTELLLKMSENDEVPGFLPGFWLLKNTSDDKEFILKSGKEIVLTDFGDMKQAQLQTESKKRQLPIKKNKKKNFKVDKLKKQLKSYSENELINKYAERQNKIDALYDNQPKKNGTFTVTGGTLSFTLGSGNYAFELGGNTDFDHKYIFVQQNSGIPLIELISFCYDKVEYKDESRIVSELVSPPRYAYNPETIVDQLATALHQLNEKLGFLHRDIKLDNICLDNENKLRLIDIERVSEIGAGPKEGGWGVGGKSDIYYDALEVGPIRNGTGLIDPPNNTDGKFCYSEKKPSCDRYQAGLALLNLGCQMNLSFYPESGAEDYTILDADRPDPGLLKAARDIFNEKQVQKNNVQAFLENNKTNWVGFNLPQSVLDEVISPSWFYLLDDSAAQNEGQPQSNRITIEYDSMSEGDIEEIEKAVGMYTDELEKYDSSSGVSEQKVSLYDSSSDQNSSSLYDSGSDVSFDKASYDSSSDSEIATASRVSYDSSSEVASETELDYSVESGSEYGASDANVPYNSDSDMESI